MEMGRRWLMNNATSIIFHWTPRLLALLFAGMLSLFAIDAFHSQLGILPMIIEFLIHLLPALLILLVLALAWHWPLVGAGVYFALGCWYIITTVGRFPWSVYLTIPLPLFIMALLFLLDWWLNCQPLAGSNGR